MKNYNSRLFRGSLLRRWYHLSRFKWLAKQFKSLPDSYSIVELGCFDGRSLDHIPKSKVLWYNGYDAGWEGGIQSAINSSKLQNVEFYCVSHADGINDKPFDIFIALETFEHLSASDLGCYLKKVKSLLHENGHVFITVPNELGLLFLLKTSLKWILHKDTEGYSSIEVVFQTFGYTSKVIRNEHKGFNYRKLAQEVEKELGRPVKLSGVQFPGLPCFFSPSIAIKFR